MNMAAKKELKLSKNKMLGGVIAGLAEYLDADTTLLRVLFAIFLILTGFFPGVVLYFAAWIIMKAAE